MAREEKHLTEKQLVGATIAAVMGTPVDPELNVPPEDVKELREEIEEMMARGVMVDIPTSIDDFDPDEFRED